MPGSIIGQYRYKGAGSCITEVPSEKSYTSTATVGAGESTTSFQDIMVVTSQPLEQDQDYYLYLQIPQDMNYDMTFNIKLTRPEMQGSDNIVYQYLDGVTIPRGGTGTNVYNVVLYGIGEYDTSGNEKVNAMIPLEYVAGTKNTKGYLYRDANTGKYYLGNGNNTYTETTHYNDVSISASWIHQTGVNYGYAEIVFRPVEGAFSQITIEMVRSAEDYNIQQDVDNEVVYGRRVTLEDFDYTLYKLSNLVDEINADGVLTRIGIWGHSGLMMAVNGEEIRIGPSGFYELDNIIQISSLGIVARDYNDSFTIDYTYDRA